MFTKNEKQQIEQHGLEMTQVEHQVKNFINGFPSSRLISSLGENSGIKIFNDKQLEDLIQYYEDQNIGKEIIKFVPASGAATRMFKKLFAFLSEYAGNEKDYQTLISDQGQDSVFNFLKNLNQFAFYPELKNKFQSDLSLEEAHLKRRYKEIIGALLNHDGLNYGALPKGLLKFHRYSNHSRTPVEEHVVEGCEYAKSDGKRVKIHFTVSPEHMQAFKDHVEEIKQKYEQTFDVVLDITFSIQKTKTDTIAVDLDNEPFKEDNGNILFRPAGHGALLENLNDIEADIIFIKNIDNVVPAELSHETIRFKKVIAGLMLKLQNQVFNYLNNFNAGDPNMISEINRFIREELGYQSNVEGQELTGNEILKVLNRPIRVCGMVKNMGEPGGGPFKVLGTDGTISPQIVETAQIDLADEEQKEILSNSSHFSPTDVVCGVKNHKGVKFNLLEFRDPSTGFITQKSKDGRELKAQELPGLWNGSMAYWNTIFVEVPLITFNPVKSVNDLLKKEHQPQ